jgi:Zn-dependent protease with chaperone function
MQFNADYFDGISPRAQRVLVTITDDAFTFATLDGSDNASHTDRIYYIKDCHIQAKLGRGRRLIDLADGGRLETDFQDLEHYLPKKSAHLFWRAIHYAESHQLIVICALISIVLSSLLLLKYGVPVAAKFAALATPPSIEKDLGKQTLEALDHQKLGYFTTSELSDAKKLAIQNALKDLCIKTEDCPSYQLNFRKSPTIGANAFALPGGYLIMTDELVALAKDHNEIIAVLAHELGHVKGRHALRQTLQGTISGIIVIAITGDVSSIAAGLPALMLNMSYSRDLEIDADHYALQSLKTACIPTQSFATLLLKLEKSHGGANTPEMISSHPNTKERILPFLSKQQPCNKASSTNH